MPGMFDLSPAERAKRYREFAAQASEHAAATQDRVARQSYLSIADQWRKRADAIEYNMVKFGTLYARPASSSDAEPPAEAATL